MTKREFFENELKMKPSEIGTAIPFNQNGETEVTEGWLISFIKNLLAERNKWHTGTPTEEGLYLYEARHYNMEMSIYYSYGVQMYYPNLGWNVCGIVAWQKITPSKENDK